MPYIVVCQVSGGGSDERHSLLAENGEVVHFKSMEAAAREASRLNQEAQAEAEKEPTANITRYWVQRFKHSTA